MKTISSTSYPTNKPWLCYACCKIFLLLVFLIYGMVAPSGVLAQPSPSVSAGESYGQMQPVRYMTRDMMRYGLEVAVIEQAYDAVLYRTLAPFFAPGSFIVDVRVEVQVHREKPVESRVAAPAPTGGIALPGMYLPVEEPAPAVRPANVVGSTSSAVQLELKRMYVQVITDNTYTDEDLETMYQLIVSTAKLEPRRGDSIKMIRRALTLTGQAVAPTVEGTHAVETAQRSPFVKPVLSRPFLPSIILAVSSALLIFVLIFLAITLSRTYA